MRAVRLTVLLLLVMLAAPLRAHDALPIALTLDQTGAREYSLRAKFPPAYPMGMEPELGVAAPCEVAKGSVNTLLIRCPDARRPGAITLAWPGPSGNAPVLARLAYIDGERQTLVAPPGSRRLALPAQQSRAGVFAGYFRAGLEHIATGFDHLLFLVCLMLIAGGLGRVAWTVTGFTLGHALTISFASLGLVRVDPGAVEVLIALSIAFAAAEIVRGERDTLTWRKPALVAALFGLLHGLGFAGALREIGLPHGEVPLALLAFNLGIEAGQLVFVAVLFALMWAVLRLWRSAPAPALAAWPIGVVASFWFVDRLAGL